MTTLAAAVSIDMLPSITFRHVVVHKTGSLG